MYCNSGKFYNKMVEPTVSEYSKAIANISLFIFCIENITKQHRHNKKQHLIDWFLQENNWKMAGLQLITISKKNASFVVELCNLLFFKALTKVQNKKKCFYWFFTQFIAFEIYFCVFALFARQRNKMAEYEMWQIISTKMASYFNMTSIYALTLHNTQSLHQYQK